MHLRLHIIPLSLDRPRVAINLRIQCLLDLLVHHRQPLEGSEDIVEADDGGLRYGSFVAGGRGGAEAGGWDVNVGCCGVGALELSLPEVRGVAVGVVEAGGEVVDVDDVVGDAVHEADHEDEVDADGYQHGDGHEDVEDREEEDGETLEQLVIVLIERWEWSRRTKLRAMMSASILVFPRARTRTQVRRDPTRVAYRSPR